MMEYKDTKSSVYSHIGNIPIHWDETRLKLRYKEVDNRSITGEEEMLSVSHITGITPRSQKNVTMFMAESNMGLKLIQPSDVVVNTMWAWMAAMGVSVYSGIVSPSYGVYRPIDVETYNPKYLNLLLRIENYRAEYVKHSTGIRASRLRLYSDKFLGLKFIRPPRDEQDQIVRYLDWKVSQINKLINAKRRQIELLGEQKRAVVNEAVTKGGEDWKEVSLGNLGSFRKGFGGSRTDDVEDGVACIRYGDIYRTGVLSLTAPITRINRQVADSYARVYNDEMLFALSGETKEEIGQSLINNTNEDTWCSGDAAIFSTNKTIIPHFLVYALRCPDIIRQKASLAKGDIIVHISTSALRRIRVQVPPVEEQQAIASQLNKLCTNIDTIVNTLNEEIALFAEYRTRLISDVVTGRLDVRGVVVPEYGAVAGAENSVEEESVENEDEA